MILNYAAIFQVLFIVSLSVLGTSLLWRSTLAFTYLKVKSANFQVPLLTSCGLIGLVILVLVLRIWFCLHHCVWVHVQAQRHKVTHRCAVSSAKSLYKPTNCARLLDYIEAGVDASTAMFPKTTIVLAGDFNSLTRRLRTCLANRSTDAWYKPSKPDIYVHDLSYATVVLLRRRSEAIIKRLSPT